MTSIFQRTEDILALEALIARFEEEETPDQERLAELSAFLVHQERLLAEKVDGYVPFYRHLEARKKAGREEARHLSELARQDDAKMGRLKEAVKFVSERLGQPKLEGKTRSIAVSTSKRPAVDILNQDAIPEEFKEEVTSWMVDKKAITEHVMATGKVVPGVETRKVISVRFK